MSKEKFDLLAHQERFLKRLRSDARFEKRMRRARDLFAASSVKCCCWKRVMPAVAHDGETWTCPKCRVVWQYVEDEAEGGAWHRQSPNAQAEPRREGGWG